MQVYLYRHPMIFCFSKRFAILIDTLHDGKEIFILAWGYVALAAIIEIFWVVGLRYSETVIQWTGTGVAIVFSFYFIIKACEKLPSGTVYAVFTGSGAAAILLVDIFIFQAGFTWVTLTFIGLIVIGVVGIKLTTDEKADTEGGS